MVDEDDDVEVKLLTGVVVVFVVFVNKLVVLNRVVDVDVFVVVDVDVVAFDESVVFAADGDDIVAVDVEAFVEMTSE